MRALEYYLETGTSGKQNNLQVSAVKRKTQSIQTIKPNKQPGRNAPKH